MVTPNLALLKQDEARAAKLVNVNNFLAGIFASLSLSAFHSNSMLAKSLSAPSWSWTQWDGSPNSQVFGTNCVLTCDGFRNASHIDRDETGYALGFWGIVDQQTGRLISSQERLNLLREARKAGFHCNALGAKFHVGKLTVDLDAADVVTMVFNTRFHHQTTHLDNKRSSGGLGANFTRCAMSNQITKSAAIALHKVAGCRGGLGEKKWLEVQKLLG